MLPKMTEEEVKDKYPEASLHKIDTNRICFSPGQLEMIFNKNNKKFNDVLLDLCKQELKRKQGKSLDFYDLANLIDRSLKETKDKGIKSKVKHASFKDDYEKKRENPEVIMGSKNEEGKGEFDVQKRLNSLENRLKMVEERLVDVETAIKEGY